MKFVRDMGITHDDFFRLLAKALAQYPYQISMPDIYVELPAGTLTICLGDESVRKIAALSLPMTQIAFTFEGVTDQTIELFFKRFDLSYHRGGG